MELSGTHLQVRYGAARQVDLSDVPDPWASISDDAALSKLRIAQRVERMTQQTGPRQAQGLGMGGGGEAQGPMHGPRAHGHMDSWSRGPMGACAHESIGPWALGPWALSQGPFIWECCGPIIPLCGAIIPLCAPI